MHDPHDYPGDPIGDFDAKVRELVARGTPRRRAVLTVAKRHPQLHRAYLLETNPDPRAQRLLRDKFSQ